MHFLLEFGTILSRGSLLTIIALWLPSHQRRFINGTAVRRDTSGICHAGSGVSGGLSQLWTASKNHTIVWGLDGYVRYQYISSKASS